MNEKNTESDASKLRRKQIEQAIDLRRRGLTYKQISDISGLGRSTARFWCDRSGAEQEAAKRVADIVESNPEILDEIRRGTSYLKLAKIHNIKPAHALKAYCSSKHIFAYTPAGRSEKLRAESLAKVLELAQQGVEDEAISKRVNWTIFAVRKAIDTGITQPHKRYWDRRGRPSDVRKIYLEKGQTQEKLAKRLSCTISQLNILLKEQQLSPRVSQRSSFLTENQVKNIIQAHAEGIKLSSIALRGKCSTKAARNALMRHGRISQETVDGWIADCSKKNIPRYQACWSCGVGIEEFTDTLYRLGLSDSPYCRPIRPDMGLSKTFKRVWSDDQRRRTMASKMYHPIDLSAERFPELDRLKMAVLRARQFRYDRTTTADYFDDIVSGIYYDPQFSAVFCEHKNDKTKMSTPSIDHVVPRSAGGTDHLTNIQFISWFENYSKAAMSLGEWEYFKHKNRLSCLLFIDSIMARHNDCCCQKGCKSGFLFSRDPQK